MTWGNHPVCRECWTLMNPGRSPAVIRGSEFATCVLCDATTASGIYVRMNMPDKEPRASD